MICSKHWKAARIHNLIGSLFVFALLGCIEEEKSDTADMVAVGATNLLAQGRVDTTDFGPSNFSASSFKQELLALCNPLPCVKPEDETNPVYQLKTYEIQEINDYKAELALQMAHENDPPPDSSDIAAAVQDRPQPVIETLRFQTRFYTKGGFEDLTPYAYTRLMLIDVGEAPKAAHTYRKYEIKRKLRLVLRRIVQLEKFIEINASANVTDTEWLESELIASYQMRRSLLAELRLREIRTNRHDPNILEGGLP